VLARGTRREYELLSLLKRTGRRFRKLTLGQASALAETTIGDAAIRDTYGVAILAVRQGDGWTLAPRGDVVLHPNDELFVVGTREDLDRFGKVVV
jgi:K+/H+ antiporter YhaU regulatory subunit KhtT